MTTPYRQQGVVRCTEVFFLFRLHVLPPCGGANALHTLKTQEKPLTDFLPLISSANDGDFKLLLPCMEKLLC